VLLEAMAASKPVVATHAGVMEVVADGVTGCSSA
jgi:glycosyltransferase involved in cell wall biosynthesis